MGDCCGELSVEMMGEEEFEGLVRFYDGDGNGVFDFEEVYDMVAPWIEEEMG